MAYTKREREVYRDVCIICNNISAAEDNYELWVCELACNREIEMGLCIEKYSRYGIHDLKNKPARRQ